jgi:glucose uptake protein
VFRPESFGVALLMMVTSTICWGSWANTYKGTRNYRFELFYWDYAVGILLISLLLAFTLGSMRPDATAFVANVRSADARNIGLAMIGGAIFNVANLLLVAGIEMAGLAVAFPVSIGIALVVGVALSYALQPKGNAVLLALGVLSAVVAVVMDGKAYSSLGSQARGPAPAEGSRLSQGGEPRPAGAVSRKSMFTCIVSGLLMGSFAPFVARAMTRGNTLGPYSVAVFFTLGALLSCFIVNIYFMRKPLAGEPVNFAGLFSASARDHFLGLLGGCIWGLGTVFNFVAASFTGVAISYAIGQAAPMVAALWGVFVWKEFAGAGAKAKTYLALMFFFYMLALLVVSRAYSAG